MEKELESMAQSCPATLGGPQGTGVQRTGTSSLCSWCSSEGGRETRTLGWRPAVHLQWVSRRLWEGCRAVSLSRVPCLPHQQGVGPWYTCLQAKSSKRELPSSGKWVKLEKLSAETLESAGEPYGFDTPPKHESESGNPLLRCRRLHSRKSPNNDIIRVFFMAQNGTAAPEWQWVAVREN